MNAPAAQPLINDPLERVRAHIEAQLFEPMTPLGLAALAELSVYHFSRQFTARFGASPMTYVRQRRLTAAAQRLVDDPPPNLIDLALDCGFDSQEGFTRAFKRVHGAPPGQYRKEVSAHLEIATMAMPDHKPVLIRSPEPVIKPALRIAGLARDFDDTDKDEIPALWMRLVPHLPLNGQTGRETFGVGSALSDPAKAGFRYLAGVAIAPDAPAPPALEVIELPARPYLVFRHEIGPKGLHHQMQAAVAAIWGELVPKSGYKLAHAPDLEYYPPDFQPNKAGWLEFWIPVEA